MYLQVVGSSAGTTNTSVETIRSVGADGQIVMTNINPSALDRGLSTTVLPNVNPSAVDRGLSSEYRIPSSQSSLPDSRLTLPDSRTGQSNTTLLKYIVSCQADRGLMEHHAGHYNRVSLRIVF